jgi:hypothetical protein
MEFILHLTMTRHTHGSAFFPFIFINKKILGRKKLYQRVLNHERIHLAQQKELLVLPFMLWYGLEYLFHYLKLLHKYKAYRKIRFEKECFDNESNMKYLNHRVPYNYILKSTTKKVRPKKSSRLIQTM